jgi:hypothetical protein
MIGEEKLSLGFRGKAFQLKRRNIFCLLKISAHNLGQEEDLQRGRGRQGLLPDFRLELPSPAGEPELRLAELKMIGAVEKWYPRNGALARRKSGVERRVIPLPAEYSNPLAKLDRKYHGVAVGQVAPLQRRLPARV